MPIGGVGRGEEYAAGFDQRQRGHREAAVIVFGAENPRLLGLREGRRIEQDQVEASPFALHAPKPIPGVAINEIVRRRIDPVQGEVAATPFEVLFREIETGRLRAGLGRGHREPTRIGEGVQDLHGRRQVESRCNMAAEQTAAIIPLIEEQPDRVALGKAQLETEAVLEDLEPFRRRLAENRLGRGRCGCGVADLASEQLMVSAAGAMLSREPGERLVLVGVKRPFRLRQEVIPKAIDIPRRAGRCPLRGWLARRWSFEGQSGRFAGRAEHPRRN